MGKTKVPADEAVVDVVDPEVAKGLAGRIVAARELGASRRVIAELTAGALSVPMIWRIETRTSVRPEEVEPLETALTAIESGAWVPPQRGSTRVGRADLEKKIADLGDLVRRARAEQGSAARRELLDQAIEILDS